MPGWDFAHVQDDVNPNILRMLENTFSLDTAHLTFTPTLKNVTCSYGLPWETVKCKQVNVNKQGGKGVI